MHHVHTGGQVMQSNRKENMLFTKQKKVTASLTTIAITLSTIGFVAPLANAETYEEVAVESTPAKETTPDELPYRPISDVVEEAQRENLSEDETAIAVDLQKMINAYHSFPEELKEKPLSDPEVQRRLASAVEGDLESGTSLRGISFAKATDCIVAIADAASIAVPGKNIWTFVKLIGGVTTVASVIADALEAKTQDEAKEIIRKRLGKEAAEEFGKIIGYGNVIDSCRDLE